MDDVEAGYTPTAIVTADEIAATIRQFDGSHTMGAGALGEVIAEEVNARLSAHDAAVRVAALEEAAGAVEAVKYPECQVCGKPTERYDSPTETFWSHFDHPADEHDAIPYRPGAAAIRVEEGQK